MTQLIQRKELHGHVEVRICINLSMAILASMPWSPIVLYKSTDVPIPLPYNHVKQQRHPEGEEVGQPILVMLCSECVGKEA